MDPENSPENDRRRRSVASPPFFATEGALLDGRYRLDDLIGRGGTAEVYRATDELLGRAVAVKIFDVRLTDLNTIGRQRSEMRLLAALDDPHLVAVYDARMVEAAGAPAAAQDHSYLVMELVSGGTLAERLRDGSLCPAEATPIGVAVAAGLAAVHARGLVHRDVKPANVLLASSGAVKLGDFGLARMVAAETRFTSGSALIGTAAYFSPEQARSEHVGAAADVYALGLVLLEALTGRREFPGAAVPSAMARLLRDPQIPDGLPAPWPMLLSRMTDQDPETRPTAADIVRILSNNTAAAAVTIDAEHAGPQPVPVLIAAPRSDVRDESVTTANSSILSAFLQPDAVGATGVRRRNGLLVGAVALVAAVALTVGISMSGEPPSDADTTPAAAQNSATRQTTPSPASVTAPTERSAAAISSPKPSTTAPARTTPQASTSPTPRPKVTSASSVASSTVPRPTSLAAAEPTPAAAPAAAQTSSAQQQPSGPATSAPPTSAPAMRQSTAQHRAATNKAAEKAADAKRKAAEKEQKAAQKAASGKSKGDVPAKPGKKH